MARDGTGRGTPEDVSKSSQRAADIAKHLEEEARRREEAGNGKA